MYDCHRLWQMHIGWNCSIIINISIRRCVVLWTSQPPKGWYGLVFNWTGYFLAPSCPWRKFWRSRFGHQKGTSGTRLSLFGALSFRPENGTPTPNFPSHHIPSHLLPASPTHSSPSSFFASIPLLVLLANPHTHYTAAFLFAGFLLLLTIYLHPLLNPPHSLPPKLRSAFS